MVIATAKDTIEELKAIQQKLTQEVEGLRNQIAVMNHMASGMGAQVPQMHMQLHNPYMPR